MSCLVDLLIGTPQKISTPRRQPIFKLPPGMIHHGCKVCNTMTELPLSGVGAISDQVMSSIN